MPSYWPSRPQPISGPWIVSWGSQALTDGQAGWPYDNVEYWFTQYTQSQQLGTKAFFDDSLVLGNVLNYDLNGGMYVNPTRVEFLISSDTSGDFHIMQPTGSLRAYSGITFTVYQSGSYSSSNVPNVSINTNIPSYSITTSYASYGGGYKINIPDQNLAPDLYYIELETTEAGWYFFYHGKGTIGISNEKDTMAFTVASSDAVDAVAINTYGPTKKILAPKPSGSSGWPFGIYFQYNPANLGNQVWMDCVTGELINDSRATGSIMYRSGVKWTPIPTSSAIAPGYFVAKTISPCSDGTFELDMYIPHTRKLTTDNYSAQRASASLDLKNGATSSISPSLWYGVAQWPVLQASQSIGPFSGSAGQGALIHGYLLANQPVDNGYGVDMIPTGSVVCTLSYYSGSTKKTLTTLSLAAGEKQVSNDCFIPVFSQVPVVVEPSGSAPLLDLFVCAPLGYVGVGVVGGSNPLVPWKPESSYLFPVSAYQVNDTKNMLLKLSASAA
jgi:hypothetical protein